MATPDTPGRGEPWGLTLAEWRDRTAGPDPTPGGGSVAAVGATFGCALVQMALAVSRGGDGLAQPADRAQELADALAGAVADDMAAFAWLMEAYRRPRDEPGRAAAVAERAVAAALAPLQVAEHCVAVVWLAANVVDRVRSQVRSDVFAGAELVRGAFGAARRTVEINLASLTDEDRAAVSARLEDAVDGLDRAWKALEAAG